MAGVARLLPSERRSHFRTVRFTSEELAWIKSEARRRGCGESEIIRLALDVLRAECEGE